MNTTAAINTGFAAAENSAVRAEVLCAHCSAPCVGTLACAADGHDFCCHGCRTVFELLHENGLGKFYELDQRAGVRPSEAAQAGAFAYLDEENTRRKIVDFSDGKFTRVTFHIPAIHCLACVWLLENLFRLRSGVGESQVNFPRKEVTIQFEDARLKLGELVGFLAKLGYEPDLKLDTLEKPNAGVGNRRLHLRIGVAGFAFGNVMLLCFPSYLGLPENEKNLQPLFGWIAAALCTPVFFYAASDYWRAFWLCIRQRMLTVEFPIFAGLAALYFQSLETALRGGGPAYFDSFAGLGLFLLCSKLFQQKTYDALSFDRDFRSYFPLSITRRGTDGDRPVSVTELRTGDRILVRNHELIPADAKLISGPACIDYSFVTGESAPQERAVGDYIYAGGRQRGGLIELEVAKATSQSYLTSLWNHAAFRKTDATAITNITNFAARYFTYLILVLALFTGAYWLAVEPPQAVRVLAAVLLVACPCALAMAAPFTFGSALRVLGRHKIYLKNPSVLETLAKVDAVVFDKTGTLTQAAGGAIEFDGDPLSLCVENRARSLSVLSTHTHSRGVATFLSKARTSETAAAQSDGNPLPAYVEDRARSLSALSTHAYDRGEASLSSKACGLETAATQSDGNPLPAYVEDRSRSLSVLSTHTYDRGEASFSNPTVEDFRETPGCGIQGRVAGVSVMLGSRRWLYESGIQISRDSDGSTEVCLAEDGRYLGRFVFKNTYRPGLAGVIDRLRARFKLALLSGDNDRERSRLSQIFGANAELRFNQLPDTKLEYIRDLQTHGHKVAMVGDGLNDAGALKQGDVGIAVTEDVGAFSPACDAIWSADKFALLPNVMRYAKLVMWVVFAAFIVSFAYNAVGITLAMTGRLSPLASAVLMPASSFSVIVLSLVGTRLAAWRAGLIGVAA